MIKIRLPFMAVFVMQYCFATQPFPEQLKQHFLIPHNQSLSAKQYILLDAETLSILDQKNADQKAPPASLTKMMAIEVISDALNRGIIQMNDPVKVPDQATKIGGSTMFLEKNSTQPLSELIKGAVIASGNDATYTLAQYISGSEEQFVELMNMKALAIGMQNTHFVTSTGMPHPEHYSTAYDMALLGLNVINSNQEIYKIYSEKWFTHNKIKQSNRNRLLWKDPSVDGIKSGHTSNAGYCLVSSAQKNGMRLIAVVLGTPTSSSRDQDSQKLLDYGFRFFKSLTLFEKGHVIDSSPIKYAEDDIIHATSNEPIKIIIPKGAENELRTEVKWKDLVAPISKGDDIATLQVYLQDTLLQEFPLQSQADILSSGWMKSKWQAMTYFTSSWF
jgi:D-alanyl-D-alanine carboxypeptidase (penicillin-binding protein 5/6)